MHLKTQVTSSTSSLVCNGPLVALQWLFSGRAVTIQWIFSGPSGALQWPFSGPSVALQCLFSSPSVALQWLFGGPSVAVQWPFSGHLLIYHLIDLQTINQLLFSGLRASKQNVLPTVNITAMVNNTTVGLPSLCNVTILGP